MSAVAVDLRCTVQAREAGVDPAGTAAAAAAVLVVELPRPWPKDVGEHPALAPMAALAEQVGARLQAVVPDPARAEEGLALAALHQRPAGPFRRYERRSAVVPFAELPAVADRLLQAAVDDPEVDLLVCGHGSRDRCCGSLGTQLHIRTVARGVRAWQTSHLGGHRFAPTALVLPWGTVWAWLDDDVLAAILRRDGDVAALRRHYRGSIAMPHPALQLVEAEAFATVGWGWLDAARDGTVDPLGDDRWEVRLDSDAGSWRAEVERTGTVGQPVCGAPLSDAVKHDDVLALRSMTPAD